jgi:hypothetical protein
LIIGTDAFTLRASDHGELSVHRASKETQAETFARLRLSDVLAEFSAESVRGLGLEVEPRPEDENPAHAAILGLPTPHRRRLDAPETVLAQDMALALIRLSEVAGYRDPTRDDLVQRLMEAGQVIL